MMISNMFQKYTKRKLQFKEKVLKIKKDLFVEVEKAGKGDLKISRHKAAVWVQRDKKAVIFSEYIYNKKLRN